MARVWVGDPKGNTAQLAPSLIALFDQADKIHPDRPITSDGSLGNAEHAARQSDHNPARYSKDGKLYVTAADLTDWDPRFDVDQMLERLRIDQDPRIKYGISDGRFFSSYGTSTRRPWEWAPYHGPNGHFHHIHISVVMDDIGLFDTRSWFQPQVTPPDIKPPFRKDGVMDILAVMDQNKSFLVMPDGVVRLNEDQFWHFAGHGCRVIPTDTSHFNLATRGARAVSFNDAPKMEV